MSDIVNVNLTQGDTVNVNLTAGDIVNVNFYDSWPAALTWFISLADSDYLEDTNYLLD